MVEISKGLASIGPSSNAGYFVRWVNPLPGRDLAIRFLTEEDEVHIADSHEFHLCQDGIRRSFVCAAQDRPCQLCAHSESPEPHGWASVLTGEVAGSGRFVEDDDGAGVLKLPMRFWELARTPASQFGTLRDRAFVIKKMEGQRTYTLRQAGEPFSKPTIGVPAHLPSLQTLINWYASESWYGKHLGIGNRT